MSTELIGDVEEYRVQRQEADRARLAAAMKVYDGLVFAAASGKHPSPQTMDAALEAAGKSLQDFAADLASKRRRIELRASIDKARALATERNKLEQQLSDEVTRYRKLRDRLDSEHAAKMNPLEARLREIDAAARSAADAEDELRKSYPASGSWHDEIRRIEAERLPGCRECDEIRGRTLPSLRSRIRRAEEVVENERSYRSVPGQFERIERESLATIQQAEREIAAAEKRLNQLEDIDRAAMAEQQRIRNEEFLEV